MFKVTLSASNQEDFNYLLEFLRDQTLFSFTYEEFLFREHGRDIVENQKTIDENFRLGESRDVTDV